MRVIPNDLRGVFSKVMEHTAYFDNDSNEIDLTDINQKDWTGDLPIHIVVRLGNIPDLRLLCSHGANVNSTGERNMTPLHYAVLKNNAAVINELLRLGADPNCRNEDGMSPIDYARLEGNKDLVSVLSKSIKKA